MKHKIVNRDYRFHQQAFRYSVEPMVNGEWGIFREKRLDYGKRPNNKTGWFDRHFVRYGTEEEMRKLYESI